MEQLGLFYPLLATHGTGQQMTVYNSIVTAPKQADEANGPQKCMLFCWTMVVPMFMPMSKRANRWRAYAVERVSMVVRFTKLLAATPMRQLIRTDRFCDNTFLQRF